MAARNVKRQVTVAEDRLTGLNGAGQRRCNHEVNRFARKQSPRLFGLAFAPLGEACVNMSRVFAGRFIMGIKGRLPVADQNNGFQGKYSHEQALMDKLSSLKGESGFQKYSMLFYAHQII